SARIVVNGARTGRAGGRLLHPSLGSKVYLTRNCGTARATSWQRRKSDGHKKAQKDTKKARRVARQCLGARLFLLLSFFVLFSAFLWPFCGRLPAPATISPPGQFQGHCLAERERACNLTRGAGLRWPARSRNAGRVSSTLKGGVPCDGWCRWCSW